MIDLLGRAGNLSKAMNMINKSPLSESPLLWRTFVNGCKLCGDLQLGKWASRKLLDLAFDEASSYILVSNMYDEGGSSWIEIDNEVHYFIANDKDHPQSREIYANLDLL